MRTSKDEPDREETVVPRTMPAPAKPEMRTSKDEPDRQETVVPRTLPQPSKQPARERPANEPATVPLPQRERKKAA